jgi:hypothetical protein
VDAVLSMQRRIRVEKSLASCDPATEHEALNDVHQQCYDLDAETLALYSASRSSKSAKCASLVHSI